MKSWTSRNLDEQWPVLKLGKDLGSRTTGDSSKISLSAGSK